MRAEAIEIIDADSLRLSCKMHDEVVVLDLFDFADTLTESDVRRIMGLGARIAGLATSDDQEIS